MTNEMEKLVLKYAYFGALEKWSNEHDFLESHPKNKISQHKEKKLYEDLKAIQKLYTAAWEATA